MFVSIRRIANTLLVISVLSFSLNLLSSVSLQCGGGNTGCLATAFSAPFLETTFSNYSQVSFVTFQTTPSYVEATGMTLAEFNTAVQLISGYMLFIAVLILIVLECLELHYIRKFFRNSRKLSA